MVFTLEWAQAITPEMTSSLWAERHVKGRWGDNHAKVIYAVLCYFTADGCTIL